MKSRSLYNAASGIAVSLNDLASSNDDNLIISPKPAHSPTQDLINELQCRRSNRKRRKINYKPIKQNYTIDISTKKTKRGRIRISSRKSTSDTDIDVLGGRTVVLNTAPQRPTVIKSVIVREEEGKPAGNLDRLLLDLIGSADQDTIHNVINTLIQNQAETPNVEDVTDVNCTLVNDNPPTDQAFVAPTRQVPTKQVQHSSDIPIPTSIPTSIPTYPANTVPTSIPSIPATVQTKPLAMVGNERGVIMEGLINTGASQTSCFLIPININDLSLISGLPAGTQIARIGGGPPSSQLIFPVNNTAHIPAHQEVQVAPHMAMHPTSTIPHPGDMTPGSRHPTGDVPPNPASQTCSVNTGSVLNSCDTALRAGGVIVNGQIIGSPSHQAKVPKAAEMGGVAVMQKVAVDRGAVGVPKVLPEGAPRHNALPCIKINLPKATNETVYSNEVEVISKDLSRSGVVFPREKDTNSNTANNDVTNDQAAPSTSTPVSRCYPEQEGQVERLLQSLQSSDNLSDILNQLTYEEMLTMVDILAKSDDTNITQTLLNSLSGSSAAPRLLGGEDDEDFIHVQSGLDVLADPAKSTRCIICGMTFTLNTEFAAHMRRHLFMHRYSCYECGYGTSSMNELLLHKSQNHEGDLMQISTDLLEKGTQKAARLVSTELDNTVTKCPVCDVEIRLFELSRHMSVHRSADNSSDGTPPKSKSRHKMRCSLCHGFVILKSELNSHTVHHGPLDRLMCFYCTETVSSVTALRSHTTSLHPDNVKSPTYQCNSCTRSFSGSYHLQRHIKTVHEQRRDFKCPDCGKCFVELHCLRRHIRNIHNQIRDHTCPVCKRGFTYRQDMFRHIMSVHQKIKDIKCPLCNKTFYHRYFIGHASRVHDLTVKYRDGICYVYDDLGNVIHKIT